MKIEFDKIQGNIFGGFNKDHAVFILFRIQSGQETKALKTFTAIDLFKDAEASTSENVLRFNSQFRAMRKAGIPEGSIEATWTNVVFTKSGLDKLGAKNTAKLPVAFLEGMAARAALLGDKGESAPSKWNDGMGATVDWENVDMMVLVASDNPLQLDEMAEGSRLKKYLDAFRESDSGLDVFDLIRGETRADDGQDQVGHEHFGFKDGVSQPGIIGVTIPDDPLGNPTQGNPGQDLLKPGEFVLGYHRQFGSAAKDAKGNDLEGLNPKDGPNSAEGLPNWVKNGSFLVFRRLAQNVQGFRSAVKALAGELGTSEDLLGAKLVGRYRTGAPLEALKYHAGMGEYRPPIVDPGIANSALGNSDMLNNDFEYGDDREGDNVPQAAHIRKAYPRNQIPKQEAPKAGDAPVPIGEISEAEAENRTQTHRLLRRGIPFGGSLGAAKGGGVNDPRGLLFFAYQSDINRQFEFVQSAWVNEQNFPAVGAGEDPIITPTNNEASATQLDACPFHQKSKVGKCPVEFKHFVKTRGGGYFFSPSIDMLKTLLPVTV